MGASAMSTHFTERLCQREGKDMNLYEASKEAAERLSIALNSAREFALKKFGSLLGKRPAGFVHGNRSFECAIKEDGLLGVTTLEPIGNKVAVIGVKGLCSRAVLITLLPKNKGKSKPSTPRWVKGGKR